VRKLQNTIQNSSKRLLLLFPDEVRFIGKEKFPTKILVWIAISARGMSKPLIRASKSEAINSAISINECLKKRLLPFIREHHQDLNYIFWTD
jgi:hypothetical protein